MAKATDLWVNIGAKTQDLEKGVDKVSASINKLAGLVASAFAVSKIAGFVSQAAELAGQVEGVSMAFKALNQPGLLKNLREATQNTVSDLKLMQMAVQANNFKIPLDQLATYLKFAQVRAQQTGQSVDYLVESIIMGLGRQSVLILDNLGISAKKLSDEVERTGDFGRAAGKIIQEELAKAGEIIETSATKTAQLNTEMENLKATLGKSINPALNELKIRAMQALSNLSLLFFGKQVTEVMAAEKLDSITESLIGLDEAAQKSKIAKEINEIKQQILEGESQMAEFGTVAGAILRDEYTDEWVASRNEIEANIKANKVLLGLLSQYKVVTSPKPSVGVGSNGGGGSKFSPIDNRMAGGALTPIDTPQLKNQYDGLKTTIDEVGNSYSKAADAAYMFSDSLASTNPENAKEVANAIRSAARDSISALIAQTVVEQVAKAASKSKTWWGAILAGAAAAAGTKALFNSVIPSFATGGIVQGAQLAMVGDNPGQKEAIIPSELWNRMGGIAQIEGKVRGYDIYWSLKNYERRLTNV